MAQRIQVLKRVAGHHNHICPLSGLQRAQFTIQPAERGSRRAGRTNCSVIALDNADLDHELHLGDNGIVRDHRATRICAKDNWNARLSCLRQTGVAVRIRQRALALGNLPIRDIVLTCHLWIGLHDDGRESGDDGHLTVPAAVRSFRRSFCRHARRSPRQSARRARSRRCQ